jgi:hypothetical protein
MCNISYAAGCHAFCSSDNWKSAACCVRDKISSQQQQQRPQLQQWLACGCPASSRCLC